MKFVETVFILSIFLSIYGCDYYIEEKITIKPQRTPFSVELGRGVWIDVPNGYRKAKSYDGYQTSNMGSSISIKMSNQPSEELKKSFDPKTLKKSKIDLIELSEVKYGENGTGFLSVIHDKKNKLIRYLLSIDEKGKTYNIKSFCVERIKNNYDAPIRRSLKSVFIGEFVEKVDDEELFKLAKLIDLNEMIFSRDGKLPTESEDEALVEWKKIESLEGVLETGLVESELQKITQKENQMIGVENLLNGNFYYGKSESDDKKAYVALLETDKQEGILVKCQGNEKCNLSDFDKFVRGKLLKTTVRGN